MRTLAQTLVLATLLPLAGLTSASAAGQPVAPKHPNIIFILMDDQGYGDVGAFYQNSRPAGRPKLKTPSLDRMAAEGMMLTNHYCAAPVCAPSRASILTGLDQGHCDLRNNEFDRPLLPDHTLGTVLKQAGYYTSVIGKWGVGGKAPPWPAHPLNRGFDEFYGYMRHEAAHHHYPQPGDIFDGMEPVMHGLEGIYSADLFTARAKAFITDHAQHHPEQPYFLYLAYVDPHGPPEIPPGPYPPGRGLEGGMQMPLAAYGKPHSYLYPDIADKPWPNPEKHFATMIRHIDDCVDDVLQTLRDLGVDKDTLVVFTSDNGPYNEWGQSPAFFDSWAIYDGFKRDLLEGGAREPTIAWWPGHIKPGSSTAELSAQYDWMPTFAEAAGLVAPASRDGVSLLPTLLGQPEAQIHHPCLYSEYFGPMDGPLTAQVLARKGYTKRGEEQAVRIGNFAGVRYDIQSPSDPLRLYHLANDPHEDHDLSQDAAEQPMLERIRTLLVTSHTPNADAPRPYDNVPLPAAPVPRSTGTLTLRWYEGAWPWTPDFHQLKPSRTMATNGFSLPNPTAAPAPFGAEWTGFVKVPATGTYQFTVQSDGGAVLWLHDSLVVHDDFAPTGAPVAGTPVVLAEGWHPIRLAYRHSATELAPVLKLDAEGPVGAKLAFTSNQPGFDKQSFAP